jgi:hypothetical protein
MTKNNQSGYRLQNHQKNPAFKYSHTAYFNFNNPKKVKLERGLCIFIKTSTQPLTVNYDESTP